MTARPDRRKTQPARRGAKTNFHHFRDTTYILHPLDNEALLAVYDRLTPGVSTDLIASNLGPWEAVSTHVFGAVFTGTEDNPTFLGMFGAAERNGHVRPWAAGIPTPGTYLADNTQLSGSASWSGGLLGLTPSSEAIAGAVDMTVELSSLTGTLHFTGLENWVANRAPGVVGTGTMWLDGDLNYQIGVSGNVFQKTGGDAGRVEGGFSGRHHEGMGGIVDRHDLSAGFVACRERF